MCRQPSAVALPFPFPFPFSFSFYFWFSFADLIKSSSSLLPRPSGHPNGGAKLNSLLTFFADSIVWTNLCLRSDPHNGVLRAPSAATEAALAGPQWIWGRAHMPAECHKATHTSLKDTVNMFVNVVLKFTSFADKLCI